MTGQEVIYIENLQTAVLHEFGISIDADECLAWFEADATIDQAVEWMNHGCGPGDFFGCADKENAWS